MRISAVLSLAASLCCLPISGVVAQGVSVDIHLGNVRTVNGYTAERYGDWHKNYRKWQPVTLYYVNGHYYDKMSRGARAVVVYRHDNDYFFPPQDKKWVGFDKRYDYKHRPHDDDYNRRP